MIQSIEASGKSSFEVVNGVQPQGTFELRNITSIERKSAEEEQFAISMQEIHHQVKENLQKSVENYKKQADLKRREVHFQVGVLVLAHLRKERFPKGQYSKLQMKKIGPCKILHKFGDNAYEIELPPNIGISPIFNISDLYHFKGDVVVGNEVGLLDISDQEWVKDLPPRKPMELECILDKKEVKKSRRKTYYDYLVMWKGLPTEDTTWMTDNDIIKHGYAVVGLNSNGI